MRRTGIYETAGGGRLDDMTSVATRVAIGIRDNNGDNVCASETGALAGAYPGLTLYRKTNFTAGQWVELVIIQNSSGNQTTWVSENFETNLSVHEIFV